MMNQRRRKHSKEFKAGAVKLVTEQGYSISEAARNLGIHPSILGRWKRKSEAKEGDGATPVSSAAMQSELNRLRKENKRLQMEREILKKAAAFFAKESD
jgi:transposase